MTRRHLIAIATAVAAILLALVPPMWVRTTGDEVTLAMRPVDPLSFFRGNYMDIRYDVPAPPGSTSRDIESGDAVYVLFADERPGRVLEITTERPSPGEEQFCIRGRFQFDQVEFPQLEQLFVNPERAREIEDLRGDALAQLKVTGRCQAVLIDIVPE